MLWVAHGKCFESEQKCFGSRMSAYECYGSQVGNHFANLISKMISIIGGMTLDHTGKMHGVAYGKLFFIIKTQSNFHVARFIRTWKMLQGEGKLSALRSV